MSAENTNTKYTFALGERPLCVPVTDHVFIKAAMALTAREIFADPTFDNLVELRGLPFDSTYMPYSITDKVGGNWREMGVVMPDRLPTGVFDRLPDGTVVTLHADRFGNDLKIRRAKGDIPAYTPQLERTKYSTLTPIEPFPTLDEADVISLILSGRRYGALDYEVASHRDARQILIELAHANPRCERISYQRRKEFWDVTPLTDQELAEDGEINQAVGPMAATVTLGRIHHDKISWKSPRIRHIFTGTSELPITLQEQAGSAFQCCATRTVRYQFDKLYSRNERDIVADVDMEFESDQAATPETRQQFTRVFDETRVRQQEALVRTIDYALSTMTLAYRDERSLLL